MPDLGAHFRCLSPQLLVSDLEGALAFYTEVLGFAKNFQVEDWYAGVGCKEGSIHLKRVDAIDHERQRQMREAEHLHVTIGVGDIADYYEAVQAAGAEIIQPLRTLPYGTEFYVADPDGNLIGFLE